MDRTFEEVRVLFEAWSRTAGHGDGPPPPQSAYEATRDAARAAARDGVRDARDWASGRLGDEAFERRFAGLVLRVAAAAWWQGMAAARDGELP